jgi:FKBP-type peptidyl-prolyl cis-trans isomerase FklB
MDPSGQTVNAYFQDRNMKKLEKENALNKQEGEAFLAKNKLRPEVKVTPSGLQYEVITMGTGEKPSATSRVKVHYHGTVPDGRIFDSSVERGQPISFGLDQVIKGWTEGLQLMPVGSKFKLYIPQELAYGANPNPASIIEPFMPLVFEVELLEIEK